MPKKVLVIVGPTASGKSALAVRLAKKFSGEVISADSRQVYRGMNIGTGKITRREMCGVPHHLLDVASPKRTFTAADFARLANKKIDSISGTYHVPIVCGGTGFYIDALLGQVALPTTPPNRALRARLQKKTTEVLFAMLKKRDPRRARRMNESDRKNPRRLIRALEITFTDTEARPRVSEAGPRYEISWIGITWPKETLKRRIRARLVARMRHGMVAEARRLHTQGLSYRRMESFGLEYRSLARFLQGNISQKEMLSELERDIYRYARRQLTYWKRNKKIRWFSPSDTRRIDHAVRAFLSK